MWKKPPPSYWVTHRKYSKEEFAAVLGDLKVEEGSENLCGWQCRGKGLFPHFHSQLADPLWGYFHNQLSPLEPVKMYWGFFWDKRGHCS